MNAVQPAAVMTVMPTVVVAAVVLAHRGDVSRRVARLDRRGRGGRPRGDQDDGRQGRACCADDPAPMTGKDASRTLHEADIDGIAEGTS
jgi:hypothetical protein